MSIWHPIWLGSSSHRENRAVWISWPRFQAPLHTFPTPSSSVGSCHTSLDPAAASNAFLCSFPNTSVRKFIQLSNRCAMCWKAISEITFNIQWNLGRILQSWYTKHQRVREQWGLSNLITAIRTGLQSGQGWGDFFSCGHPPQLNSVGSGVDWVTGLFSLWVAVVVYWHYKNTGGG